MAIEKWLHSSEAKAYSNLPGRNEDKLIASDSCTPMKPPRELKMGHDDAKKRSNRCRGHASISSTDVQTPSVCLVPLGQDMSSFRRKILAEQAEEVGLKIVLDVFDASHLVVSQQVSSFSDVAQALRVSEADLRRHIRMVSLERRGCTGILFDDVFYPFVCMVTSKQV